MKSSLLLVGVVILALYLWFQSQSTTRGLPATKTAPKPGAKSPASSALCALKSLFPSQKPSAKAGSGAPQSKIQGGGGGGSGSGAGTAGGSKCCNKTPGTSFCGCNSCLKFAGTDDNGNEIYQKDDGSFVYSDGSAATGCDITCITGACVGTAFNPTCIRNCFDVPTNQPCSNPGASGGCSGGCFCAGGCGGGF